METVMTADQYYLFTVPWDSCPVWSETWLADGTHTVAPTPFSEVADAYAWLKTADPAAVVDELDDPADIDECREWARTMPLEQIG
jgi:hypothetical protein